MADKWTEEEKKENFKAVVEKAIEIIDRQLDKIAKTGKGRKYSYTPEDVEKINNYLIDRVSDTTDALEGKVEVKEKFTL